jgi:hypothetical protein
MLSSHAKRAADQARHAHNQPRRPINGASDTLGRQPELANPYYNGQALIEATSSLGSNTRSQLTWKLLRSISAMGGG